MTERPDPNAAHAQTLRDLKADDPDFEPDRGKPDFGEAVRRARSRLGPEAPAAVVVAVWIAVIVVLVGVSGGWPLW